jgi:hypothetical protein
MHRTIPQANWLIWRILTEAWNDLPPRCKPISERAVELGPMPMAVCPWSKVEQLESNIISIFTCSLQLHFTVSMSIDLFLPWGLYYNSPYKAVSLHLPFNVTSKPSTLETCELHSSGCMFAAHKSAQSITRPIIEIQSECLLQGGHEDFNKTAIKLAIWHCNADYILFLSYRLSVWHSSLHF